MAELGWDGGGCVLDWIVRGLMERYGFNKKGKRVFFWIKGSKKEASAASSGRERGKKIRLGRG